MLLRLHPRVFFARLSSLIHHSPPENDAPDEPQQPFTPSQLRPHALLPRLPSLFPRSRLNTGEDTDSHPTMPSGSRSDTLMDLLSSLISSPPHTIEEIEPRQHATRLHVVDVAPMRDREVLFVAERAPADRPHHQSASTATPGARRMHSRPIRLLGHIGLFLCCVCNHKHADGNVQPTQQPQGQSQGQMQTHATSRKQQQEGDSQGQVQAQASSSQTQPTPPSASATPTILLTHITVPGASA
ncbi:hypothetical protein EDD22DRAFT_414200 [Suillus occidentalis]|nr:hypothetical protein EDD22DRAFT_414200 [Suillus occidentalis]